jgi:salicylate hydroxylase
MDWPINAIEIPETWASQSGKFVLTGDAAHAMVPYMALGAAMAVEDAAAMAAALKYVHAIEDLPDAIALWTNARVPRVKRVHEASFANGLILHLPDGPVQRARDEAMRAEVEGKPFTESANQWADPVLTEWAYRHDPVAEVEWLRAQANQNRVDTARS